MMEKVGLLSKNLKKIESLTNNNKRMKHGVTSERQKMQLIKTNGVLLARLKIQNLNHHDAVTPTPKKSQNQATRKSNLCALMVLTL